MLTTFHSWVSTEMGINGGRLFGFGDITPPVTIADSASGTVQVIDDASKELHGGRFWSYEGKEEIW